MVIDNSVMNKICRGKFSNDDKKPIKVSKYIFAIL